MKIFKFLFLKNLWILDLVTCLCFAGYAGYLIHRDSIINNPNSKTHWDLIMYDVLAYVVTFIVTVILRNKVAWARSWMWLGVIGAAVRASMIQIMYLPLMSGGSKDNFAVIIFNWLGWTIAGLILIFTVRFVAYLCQEFYRLCSNFIKVLNNKSNTSLQSVP